MSALLYFLPLFKAHAGRFGLALMLSLLALAAGAALLGTSGWFITAAAISAAGVSFNIFGPSALVRGFSFIRILARYGERLAGHDATLKLLSDIRSWLFGRLFPLVPFAGKGTRHGDLVSRLVADVEALDTLVLVAAAPVIAATVVGAMVASIVWVFLPAAAVVYGIALMLSVIVVPGVYIALSRGPGEAVGIAAAAVRTATLDGIDGHRDLVAAGAIGWAEERLAASATDLAKVRQALGRMVALASASVQLLAATAMLGVLWFGIEALHTGKLGGPMLVGLLLAVIGSFEATAVVVRSVGRLGIAVAAAERLKRLATLVPPIADPLAPQLIAADGDIVFNHVSFGYDPARPVLDDVSVSIRKGSRMAILGPSGTGKSTFAALLLRLADPQAGSISIGGVDLRRVRPDEVHRHVALLTQDSPVFIDSVRDNLLIGRADATDTELWQALVAAHLAEFVRGLPEGLDTLLGEAGRTMSTGQARRLCLARALLSPAEIIVLDEPTSGLDAETEGGFLADLAGATARRTVIVATHAALPPGAIDAVYRLVGGRLSVLAPIDSGQGAIGDDLVL